MKEKRLTEEEILLYQDNEDMFSEENVRACELYQSNGGRTSKHTTNWPAFNDWLGGGIGLDGDGELVVVGGKTKIGKSTLAAHIAVHELAHGTDICYIPLENSIAQIGDILSKVSGIGIRQLQQAYSGKIRTPSKRLLRGEVSWGASGLIKHMEYMHDAYGTELFILDHLQFLFRRQHEIREQVERIQSIMADLSSFCVGRKLTVIAVSHINSSREYQEKNGLASVDNLFGGNAIPGAATKVIMVNRDIHGPNKDKMYVDLQASRHTEPQDDLFVFDVSRRPWTPLGTCRRDEYASA